MENKLLDQAKNDVAVKNGFKDWDDYVLFMMCTKVPHRKLFLVTDLVAERYAELKNEWKVIDFPDGWDVPDENGNIELPGELEKLFNKLGFQLRFVTLSGKNDFLAVAHMCKNAYDFFKPKQITDGKG